MTQKPKWRHIYFIYLNSEWQRAICQSTGKTEAIGGEEYIDQTDGRVWKVFLMTLVCRMTNNLENRVPLMGRIFAYLKPELYNIWPLLFRRNYNIFTVLSFSSDGLASGNCGERHEIKVGEVEMGWVVDYISCHKHTSLVFQVIGISVTKEIIMLL